MRCKRVWGRLLSRSLLLSLKCGCSVSSLVGSAASSFLPVVTWSGHSVGQLRLLLHPEWGFSCALLLWLEIQPLGCCFDGFVLRLHLLVASVSGLPDGGRDGACLTLDQVVRGSSASGAEFEFWRPGVLCWFLAARELASRFFPFPFPLKSSSLRGQWMGCWNGTSHWFLPFSALGLPCLRSSGGGR